VLAGAADCSHLPSHSAEAARKRFRRARRSTKVFCCRRPFFRRSAPIGNAQALSYSVRRLSWHGHQRYSRYCLEAAARGRSRAGGLGRSSSNRCVDASEALPGPSDTRDDPECPEGFVASDDLATLLSTYGAIARSTSNKRRAEQILGRPLDASVSSDTSAGTGILTISATSTSPTKAAADAQALSTAFEEQIQNNGLLVVQLVDSPSVPTTPVQPRPPLIIATGLVVGLGLGLALALVIERWFGRVENDDDVREATPVPVLARIPRARKMAAEGARALVWDDPELFRLQEAIRTLRTNLQFSMESEWEVLQITSPSAGDGKSTVAANLAIATAGVGVRTLLVDADFWASRQHVIFDVPNHKGLSTLMSRPLTSSNGSTKLPIIQTRYKNLSLLPAGPAPDGPTEVIHAQIETTICRLREDRSVVIIDSPPILALSDASLIAPHADHVILVVNARTTKPTSLRHAVDRLRLAKGRLTGVVLNQTAASSVVQGYYPYYRRGPSELVGSD
jgi:capsular exopolysaccharide synthesis family protein